MAEPRVAAPDQCAASKQTEKQVAKGNGPLGQTALAQQAVLKIAHSTEAIVLALSAPHSGLPAATRAELAGEIPSLRAAVAKVPHTPEGNKPVTLGIGEPFTTTITVTLLFALVISLPVILFELYGFVLPAFSPRERRIAMPLLVAIPFLFVIGRRVRLLRRATRRVAVLSELQQ